MLGALSIDGIEALMTVQDGKTGPVLLRFIEEELAPKLRPGDDVVLDNLRAHHVEGVRARIEATGARLLYQPLHSPDLNPIELAWSKIKIKSALRVRCRRSVALLTLAIYFVARNISPKDAAGWFKRSGVLRTSSRLQPAASKIPGRCVSRDVGS